MKRIMSTVLLLLLLTGCKDATSAQDSAIGLRDKLYKCVSCQFTATVVADYADEFYTFTMECRTDATGELQFCVLAPDSIRDIRGKLTESGGDLTFDDKFLAFQPVADGLITPVCTPWLLIRSLRSGYFASFGTEDDGTLVQIDDSYQGESLQVDVILDASGNPTSAQFLWKGRRVLSMEIEDFTIV